MLSLNISSFYSQRLAAQSDKTEGLMEHLSSGLRINDPKDDAAGSSLAEALRSQVDGIKQAQRNIQDAMNIVKIGDDALNGLFPLFDQMRELTLRAANSTNTQPERDAMQGEMDQLRGLFAQAYFAAKDFRIALDGKDNADRILNFQVGPNAGDLVTVDYNPLRNQLGNMIIGMFGYEELYNSPYQELLAGYMPQPIPAPNDPLPPPPVGPAAAPGTSWAQYYPKNLLVNSGNSADIDNTLSFLDTSKSQLVAQDAYLGSINSRLEHTADHVSAFEVDFNDSLSKIRDIDVAQAMSELTKVQVSQQASQAMLAQANIRPQQVLDLLRSSK